MTNNADLHSLCCVGRIARNTDLQKRTKLMLQEVGVTTIEPASGEWGAVIEREL